MMTGTCKWFDAKKGYGFISGSDGKEYFVHFSQIEKDGFRKLRAKQYVEFELDESPDKREMAVNVRPSD